MESNCEFLAIEAMLLYHDECLHAKSKNEEYRFMASDKNRTGPSICSACGSLIVFRDSSQENQCTCPNCGHKHVIKCDLSQIAQESKTEVEVESDCDLGEYDGSEECDCIEEDEEDGTEGIEEVDSVYLTDSEEDEECQIEELEDDHSHKNLRFFKISAALLILNSFILFFIFFLWMASPFLSIICLVLMLILDMAIATKAMKND